MPKHKAKLILNPNADLGRAWREAAALRPIVEGYGGADWAGTVYPTHATELARQAAEEGYEIVAAVGGDGTAHEVLNGLMQAPAEKRPRFGLIPLGSGNDFAHSLGIEKHHDQAVHQLFSGKSHRVDICSYRDNLGRHEFWGNALGIGFDATVTIRSRRFVHLRGFLLYFVAVLQTILLNHDAPLLHVKSDSQSWDEQTIMLVLCNGDREGGGFHVAPSAINTDGLLDYAGVCRVSRLMMLRLLPEVMKGTHGRFKQIRMGQFQRMDIQSEQPLNIHIDGEIFADFSTDVRQISVEIHPGALEVAG
jgi:YegS/Rv2252/BmrU family lipid kinase